MNHFDERLKQRARQEPFQVPESFQHRVQAVCASLEEDAPGQSGRQERRRKGHWRAWSAAAAVALFVALPNVSVSAASALEQVPVLGGLVRVITLRNYFYDDGHSTADVSVPQITGAGAAGEEVNQDVQANIQRLLDQFYQDADLLAQTGGHQSLSVSYDVVTDNDHWFTLRVSALQVQGSGNQILRYYHINKDTGAQVTLSSLFPEGSDYVSVLSQQVREQLQARQGRDFFQDFTAIDPEQSFYWGEGGSLVLVFDEGSVLPASCGNPEVTIPAQVVNELRQGG